jgi:Cu2+-containing amine oxidase
MSIRELDDKFRGLRVQRNINGVSHVKHYSYRIPLFIDGTTTWRAATRAEKKAIAILAEAYDQKLK